VTALGAPQPRTLTESLRAMSAEELATLLALRPDLRDPVPVDISELASRSTTSASCSFPLTHSASVSWTRHHLQLAPRPRKWCQVALGRSCTDRPLRVRRNCLRVVERFVIQTDLTAVTPGPLEHTVAADLRLLADQESRGGGGVYRFSATSLRRAFDQGWSASEVRVWLERHATTDVPSHSSI
jgi:Helicase conserved C-terminal domain